MKLKQVRQRHDISRVASLTTLLLAACFVGGCLTKGGNIPPPEPDEVADAWAATVGGWAFYRAVFRQDGTGLLAVTYHDEPTMVYRITSWELTDKLHIEDAEPDRLRGLHIEVEPVEGARALRVSGWAGRRHLRLYFSWEEWDPRWVRFQRESVLEARAKRTKAAMNRQPETDPREYDTGSADVPTEANE